MLPIQVYSLSNSVHKLVCFVFIFFLSLKSLKDFNEAC